VDGFLFKIADESVANLRGNQIRKEITVEENTLCEHYRNSEENSRVPLVKEKEKVHSLVLCLLQQVVDPAMVAL